MNDINIDFKEIFKKYEPVTNIETIEDTGEVSQTFKVTTQNKIYILKTNSLDHFKIYEKEKWCTREALHLGIPVPQILEVSSNNEYCWTILEFITGENCSKITDQKIKLEVYRELGKWAKELSQIKPNQNIADLKASENAEKWFIEDYLNYEINQTKKEDDYLEITDSQRKLILENLELLKNTKFEFVLCHGDLSLQNCLMNTKSNTLTLIDFGSAETQPKFYFEIMLKWLEVSYEKNLSNEEFSAFKSQLLGEDWLKWLKENEKIIKAFALVYTLDKYRWAFDKNPNWVEKYQRRFNEVLGLLAKTAKK